MTLLNWFHRCEGSWRSERRYLFKPTKSSKPSDMTTDFTIEPQERSNEFKVSWTGQTTGVMDLRLEGDLLHRSRDYLGNGAHASRVEQLDEDTVVMYTSYDGLNFREEIRFLQSDMYRLRQTVGTDDNGVARIVGQYFEHRI